MDENGELVTTATDTSADADAEAHSATTPRLYGELTSIRTTDGTFIQGFPVVIANPPKTAVLRLPTNSELMAYLGRQRSRYKDLGRRKGQTMPVSTGKADLELFTKLRLAGTGDPFDEFEAGTAINKMMRQRITDCERVGQGYQISLETAFGMTVHTIGIPTERQMDEYLRTFMIPIDLPHGVTERRFPPEAPVKLYDACIQSISGYIPAITPQDVPPNHKTSVCMELASALNEQGAADDPNS